MRLATLSGAALGGLFLAWPVGAVGAPAPALPKVKERVVARHSATVQLGLPQATSEYLGWLETSRTRGTRLAVASPSGLRRTAWQRKVNSFSFHRGVDARTGEVAVRATLWHCKATGACTLRSTRNPGSLRRSSITWSPEPGPRNYWYGTGTGAIIDGATQLTYRDTPEARSPQSGDLAYVGLMRPTGCDIRDARAQRIIPVLHDCGSMSVYLRGGLLAVRADVPSQTLQDHYSTQRRLDVLDLESSTPTWRRLGSDSYGRGGSQGVKSVCLLDDAIAVLTGTESYYDDPSPAAWKLTVLPLRRGAPSWQAAAPQFVDASYNALACTAREVYAIDSRTHDLVRLLRPKGAPAAGETVN